MRPRARWDERRWAAPLRNVPSIMKQSRIERVYGSKFIPGNNVALFYEGSEVFSSIFLDIQEARKSICLVFYIFRDDSTGRALGDALKKKALEGVRVCILYDHFGSLGTPKSFWRGLRSAGIEVRASRPFRWHRPGSYVYRDHRKLIVIDGEIAFTGGLNIGDEYSGYGFFRRRKMGWRDTAIRVTGPAAARLYEIFDLTWRYWNGAPLERLGSDASLTHPGGLKVMPIFSSSARGRKRMRRMFHWCIRNANRQISLTTAYFTPSRRLMHILGEAVRRGVRVRLLLPSRGDVTAAHYAGRAFFSQLLKAGVEIYLYRESVLHAKTYIFDKLFSIVGSANLDFQSMRKNDEGNIGVFDVMFAREMEMVFEIDLARSEQVSLSSWQKRPLLQKIMELFFAMFRRRL